MQTTLKNRDIVPGENHRTYIDPDELEQTRQGIIAAGGILQPILVRPIGGGLHEIIAGYCRWTLTNELYGMDFDMPVLIREATDAEAAALGIIENDKRNNPSEPDKARGAARLLSLNRGDKELTARQLGWASVDILERRLLLLQCDSAVLDAVTRKKIKLGHAELLAGLPADKQTAVLAGVIEHNVPVEVLKRQLGQFAKRLADAIFDTAACLGCPHNSAQQSALFDESLGEGYCQHPTHFEELTLAVVEAKATPLREQFQVVKIIRAGDGFTSLPVRADGELGVGEEQYAAVEESLCFDAPCHATKVADRRKSDRKAAQLAREQADASSVAPQAGAATSTASAEPESKKTEAKRAANHTPPKVAQFRNERWRSWVANALMADEAKNHRVLAALIASSDTHSFEPGKFVEATCKLAAPAKFGANLFKGALEQADAIEQGRLAAIVRAVTASAMFGVDPGVVETLLNYLGVDETKLFRLDSEYLELLTMNELESLAEELKLRKAMGDSFKKARASAKPKFIEALLNVKGFDYTGVVPRAMRYPRRKFRCASEVAENASPATAEAAVTA